MQYKEYWEKNINNFAKIYDSKSEEKISAPKIVDYFYRRFIFPVERRAVVKRHYEVIKIFSEINLDKEAKIIDIGCGSGIFTIPLIQRGYKVIAADFSQSALDLTEKTIKEKCPKLFQQVSLIKLDITKQSIPKVDFAMAIGVSMYVKNILKFYNNILPYTKIFLDNFQCGNHWINRIRRVIPIINVRQVNYFDQLEQQRYCEKFNFYSFKKVPIGTGYLELLKKKH